MPPAKLQRRSGNMVQASTAPRIGNTMPYGARHGGIAAAFLAHGTPIVLCVRPDADIGMTEGAINEHEMIR